MTSSIIAAGFAVAGHAHAQQDLSAQEVTSFLERAEQDLTQMMQAREYSRLLDWTKENIADGATFHVSQEFHAGDERKGFAVMSLDKQDMLRLGRVAVGLMSDMPAEGLQDYTLDIEVINVEPIGPNAATATTRIIESGKLVLSGAQNSQQPTRIEATARCNHLIQRDRNADRLLIGMSACEARTRL